MNTESDFVSIIMAAYNAEKTIELSIASAQKQTFSNWELIVVNDSSKDATEKIVSSLSHHDSRIVLINNETNMGVSLSRKIGLDHAKGNWIAILDSDDLWSPDKLEKQLCVAKKYNAELVYTGSSFISNEDKPFDWILHLPQNNNFNELLKHNFISNSSVLIKKDVYSKYYSIGDKMHEDYAIWIKVLKSGHHIWGIDEPLLIYRLSKKSKTCNKWKSALMNWNTFRYVGLKWGASFYYMFWYAINGLLKYRNLKDN